MRVYQVSSGVVMLALITVAMVAPRQGVASPPGVSECPSDIVGNGVIDAADVVEVVLSLGPCRDCPAELTGDGVVDAVDVMAVVANLGGCASTDEPTAVAGSMHICALPDDSSFATADGGCKDLATGLVWSTQNMDVVGGGVSFGNAGQAIADSSQGGVTDWRMPTAEEMQTVAANGSMTHFSGFSCLGGGNFPYWSSDKQGRWRFGVNVCNGDTDLYQAGGPASDFIYFVGVRDANGGGDPPDPPGGSCNDNGVCDSGEDCDSCDDCAGKSNGPPSGRFCCGNGVLEGPEGDGSICDDNP